MLTYTQSTNRITQLCGSVPIKILPLTHTHAYAHLRTYTCRGRRMYGHTLLRPPALIVWFIPFCRVKAWTKRVMLRRALYHMISGWGCMTNGVLVHMFPTKGSCGRAVVMPPLLTYPGGCRCVLVAPVIRGHHGRRGSSCHPRSGGRGRVFVVFTPRAPPLFLFN